MVLYIGNGDAASTVRIEIGRSAVDNLVQVLRLEVLCCQEVLTLLV
jgi:hypothetical protein